jgi:hypothetical protein
VIPLCLRHRLRKDPLETIDSGEKCKTCLKVLVKVYKVVVVFRIIDFYKCKINFLDLKVLRIQANQTHLFHFT